MITVGGDAPEDEFLKAMMTFKEETSELIEQEVQTIIDEQEAERKEVDALPFEEEE